MVFDSSFFAKRLISLACLPALILASSMAYAQMQLLDRIIAIVDGDIILASEFQHRMQTIRQAISESGEPMPPEETLTQEVLDRMILERIQLQIGERIGVRFSDAEINEAMSTIAARNGVSLDQFRRQLEARGESYVTVREQVVQEMIINSVQQGSLRSRIQVTEQDIDNYLRTDEGKQRTAAVYRVAHLLLPVSSEATPEIEQAARSYLTELRESLLAPGEFERTVQDPPQKPYVLSGGDLGWRNSSNLPTIFVDVVPTLEVSEVSEPIRSASGYHLIKLLAKRGGEGQQVHQTHARHLLIKPSEIRSNEQARELAESLRQRILNGEKFETVAREFSEDIGSAQEGGDLGWINPGQMVPEFEQVMNETPSNAVSEVFQTEFGWHFLEVLDRRVRDVSKEMRRNQARNILYAERFDEELQLWLHKIRDEAFVEIKL